MTDERRALTHEEVEALYGRWEPFELGRVVDVMRDPRPLDGTEP